MPIGVVQVSLILLLQSNVLRQISSTRSVTLLFNLKKAISFTVTDCRLLTLTVREKLACQILPKINNFSERFLVTGSYWTLILIQNF